MIKKPYGYDEATAYTGETQSLPKGKYICSIVQATTETTRNGNTQLVLFFDIVEGEYKGFYNRAFESDKARNGVNAKWRGMFRQNMEGKGIPWLKGIIKSIEKSNNFTFPWDLDGNEKALVGKRFGGVFHRRQYETQNGKTGFVTELFQIRSIDALEDAKVPDDELLPDKMQGAGTPSPFGDGFMNIPDNIADEGLPFN